MFDFLGAGVFSLLGTVVAVGLVVLLHKMFPQAMVVGYVDALVIALGFVVGAWFDTRRPRQ
jgi:hypothetical protein